MLKRREFIKGSAAMAAYLALRSAPAYAMSAQMDTGITILHTNDMHSRIEPFPMDGSKFQGMGGMSARAVLIDEIRKQNSNLLLLDAGDIWQGTPYFNFFDGELEYKLMNELKYDAATLGNHDFDIGLEGLNKQLPIAKFAMLNANYDFKDTILAGKIEPYKIFQRGEIKIGVFGVGIELEGLVPSKMYGNTVYKDPIPISSDIAHHLRFEQGCHLVICLSHLGYRYEGTKVSDHILAAETSNIDLIIGGHTHTFLDKPDEVKNKDGKMVLINQVGWAGLMLGRIDFHFGKMSQKKAEKFSSLVIKN